MIAEPILLSSVTCVRPQIIPSSENLVSTVATYVGSLV
jgi:hypothetical protein